MEDTITYRIANIDDALTLCELGQLLNSIHHTERPDIYAPATSDVARDLPHWASFFEKPRHVVFIAEIGQIGIAFITANLATSAGPLMQPLEVARIGSVCVKETFWGKGIGRGLIQRVQHWAIEHGAQDIRLAVWGFNERAVHLYTELGFENRAIEMGMRLTANSASD
ncbi:GNAT family N-acetyltransferase [Pseudomonas sp. McL0111]|uniref:GNAT family N-acetyltransferase n=1 Tax=Pseudomonas sp. McL0111 TaxID=3457357 RepID=UPI00403EDA56